jgi:hypothetical protein
MRKRYARMGSVLLAAALAMLLIGCVYGRPGYYAGDPYVGTVGMVDPGAVVLGTAAAGIEQLPVVGPLLDALSGGALGYYSDYGYGYNDPYYADPYYNDPYYNERYDNDRPYDDGYYDDPYYDGRYGYDPYCRDPNHRGGYDGGYPYGNGPNYGYDPYYHR